MKTLEQYLQDDGLYDDAAIVRDTMAEHGVDRSIARNTDTTPVPELLLAARTHNVELLALRKQETQARARQIIAQSVIARADWQWLEQHGYAQFSAEEATPDGAYFHTSYRLTSKAEELE
jgi:hypothetical protein